MQKTRLSFLPGHHFFLRIAILLFASFTILPSSLHSQGHDNVWVFGNGGGVAFNGGGPTVIPATAIATSEGSASISDASGNLLFYTDGISVWDANNNLVPSPTLPGNPSSTQSGVIIPRPGTDDYFILAVDFLNGSNDMAYFDANINSGVITSVTTPASNLLIGNSSEKIAAFRKPCDPDTIWVVGHNFAANRYEVFAATNSGITAMTGPGSTTPDLFSAGGAGSRRLGVLRFNHTGTLLASAVWGDHVELIQFNPNTGQFQGGNLKFDVNTGTLPERNTYGLEFSPDNQTLYATITGSSSLTNNQLVQFDLSTLSEVPIENSRLLLQNFGNAASRFEAGQLTLGPDGNIYASMRRVGSPTTLVQTFLGRISNPNTGGIANWNSTAIPGPVGVANWAVYGLPNFLTEPIAVTTTSLSICTNGSVQLNAGPGFNYSWTPTNDLSCTTCANPVASPSVTTTYTVQYQNQAGNCVKEEFLVEVIDCDPCETLGLSANFSYSTNLLNINVQDLSTTLLGNGVTYIEWNFGDGVSGWIPDNAGTDYDYTYPQSGNYSVCIHAASYVTPDVCCHDTFCIDITIEEGCEGYTADFSILYDLTPNTATFEDITPLGSDVSIWDFGDGTVATTPGTAAPGISHTFPGNGSFIVTMVAINHLNDTVCCIDTVRKDVRFSDKDGGFRVGPSVATDLLNFSIDVDDPAKAFIQILDSQGKVISKSQGIRNGEGELDVRGLSAGVYYLRIQEGDSIQVTKFIKQ